MLDQLKPFYDAFLAGHYVLAGAIAIIAVVGLLRRFAAPGSWVYTNPGGTALALVTSTAGAVVVTLAAPGATVSLSMLWAALLVGVTAAGGYASLKNLLVDPVLRPLAAKAPAWTQPIFALVFYIFDKPADPVATATAAGNAAVAAAPGTGVVSVIGTPTDIE
jgi:hypothetical protein